MSYPPPTPDEVPEDAESSTASLATFSGRVPLQRSLSHNSHWSSADTPQHNHGSPSFPQGMRPASPAPRRVTYQSSNNRHPSAAPSITRRGARSTSVTSWQTNSRSYGDDSGMLNEEGEGADGEEADFESGAHDDEGDGDDDEERLSQHDDDPITLKDRQSLINVEHPFGLPIWKPALYKKSRSVTRYADQALHSVPSAQAERHLLPGNILWAVLFGWWLSLSCLVVAAILYFVPMGGRNYASLIYGLGWYLFWPFGKYVEGDFWEDSVAADEELAREGVHTPREPDRATPPEVDQSPHSTITPRTALQHATSISWEPVTTVTEATGLLSHPQGFLTPSKSYGATPRSAALPPQRAPKALSSDWLGKAVFWIVLVFIIAPLMLIVCVACWGLVFTIPMAKLTWALLRHLFEHPYNIRFCAAPAVVPMLGDGALPEQHAEQNDSSHVPPSFKPARLSAGQAAPSGSPTSTVLLCTYRAFGWKYYKYTVGGVNILFVNLMPIVFFVILDGFILLPLADRRKRAGQHVPAFLALLTSRVLIFMLSLTSVIPLSYFIGMAVASISAQSSIGMGAVINATFGSIIEIILYSIALTQSKGHLVEGSIVGSLLAGVLLMPGVSMISGAIRKKEQKFNAKSAGVTSMLLIMAFVGTLAPTLFYQTYGSFQLVCDDCPPHKKDNLTTPWVCHHCYYEHPDPMDDPFYQSTVKTMMYLCAVILLLSYLIGLWFSLRTHASQIWQNPQQLLHMDIPVHSSQNRVPIYQRRVQGAHNAPASDQHGALHHKASVITNTESEVPSRSQTPLARTYDAPASPTGTGQFSQNSTNQGHRRISYASPPILQPQAELTPVLESVDHAMKDTGLRPVQLSETITPADFTRAVAVATVSALRHQQTHAEPHRARHSVVTEMEAVVDGGHDAPSWSRTTSASVLLACTALYAMIAELLVDVVDVILEGSGIDEKFLGVTLFALVPNTTEFLNAISFAMNGNIALSMEIGSAYALQVCLLQVPIMVAFSAWYAPEKMGSVADTFTLIFPRWDVVVIILSVFLLTYTYIEARSNYHRGSILVLSYVVLISGFYFAPQRAEENYLIPNFLSSLSTQSVRSFLHV